MAFHGLVTIERFSAWADEHGWLFVAEASGEGRPWQEWITPNGDTVRVRFDAKHNYEPGIAGGLRSRQFEVGCND